MRVRRRFISEFSFALLLLLGGRNAVAAIGFQPISSDELKMTAEPRAPGAPAILLFREVMRDDNGSTSQEDNYFRIKILTEEGRKYADIEIPFIKGSDSIGKIKARTIRPDGSVENFQGQVFEKYIVKAKGLKYLAKTFTFPNVQVGSSKPSPDPADRSSKSGSTPYPGLYQSGPAGTDSSN